MWRKDKYYVLYGMTLNWWFTLQGSQVAVKHNDDMRVIFVKCCHVSIMLSA